MPKPRAFVMGHPIGHSRSPLLHGYWLRQQGVEGSYEALDIAPEALAGFFAGYRAAGWIGGNVTVPHKLAVMPFLDRIDAAAQAIGAVNTIWWEAGQLVGGNTDALGFIGNLDEGAPGWDRGGRALVLGAGGATRAAVHGLLGRGFAVDLCNRTPEKAEALAGLFGEGVSAHGLGAVTGLMPGADLLVNTTSLGMQGQPPLALDLGPLKPGAVVCDAVYVPLETALLRQAAAAGHPTVDGLGMLLHQGIEGFRRWFGKVPEITPELRRLLASDIVGPGA